MPKLLSFYQDVTTFGSKTTKVPFRAGNPIISMRPRPFMGSIILKLFCLFGLNMVLTLPNPRASLAQMNHSILSFLLSAEMTV